MHVIEVSRDAPLRLQGAVTWSNRNSQVIYSYHLDGLPKA